MASDSRDEPVSDASEPGAGAERAGGDEIPGRDATPSVLAVVVAHDPGEHLEVTLESLRAQDYERLSVVVLTTAGTPDLTERVQEVLPDARVVGTDGETFAATANAVLDLETTAAFLAICHDDVALAPDAIRAMAVEALRSNAGVIGPKLVDWEEPDRLQHVGLVVDRFAVSDERIEPGERDQEQHDAIRDVFAVPSACVLVRRDLFRSLGGYDAAMTFRGEDVDLCWRAQLAGARVVVVPDAVARHRERLVERRGVDDIRRTRARHSLRAVMVNHGRLSLLLVLPLALLMSGAEAALALLTGRMAHLRDVVSAWTWNLRRLPDVARRRRSNRSIRRVRPADVVVLQYLGSVRLAAFVSGRIGRDRESGGLFAGAGRGLVATWRTGTTRAAVLTWAGVLLYTIYGSRALITDGVPVVGDFAAFPDRAQDLLSAWWHGWYERDLGAPGTSLGGVGFLGAVAWLTSGSVGLTRTLWVLGPVVIGLVGIWRVLGVTGSRRGQMGALVGYVVIPLAFTSIAAGSIAGLVAYAAAPWMLAGLLRLGAAPPFRSRTGPAWSFLPTAVALGFVTGVAAAFEPAAAGLPLVIGGGLILGGLLAAHPGGPYRIIAGSVVAAVVAGLLNLPLVLDVVDAGADWAVVADGRSGGAGNHSLSDLIRFTTGPHDGGVLLWALAVVVVVPLLLGRGWRFELAVRCWVVAAGAWALAFAAERGDLPVGLPDVELLLAPAAAAMATTAGLAVTAIEHDLRFARFGWRQALLPLAVVGALVAAVPAAGLLIDGRWELARGDYRSVVPFEEVDEGGYRVLWIGAPEHLPAQGRELAAGLAWVATTEPIPTVIDRNVPAAGGESTLVEDLVFDVLAGDTSRAGRRLAGLGVRYVILVDRLAPAPFSTPETALPVPEAVSDAFGDQLDLHRIEGINSALELYLNTVWAPVRSAYPPGFDADVDELADLERYPLGSGTGVLSGQLPSWDGAVPDGAEILVLESPDDGWELEVGGGRVPRRLALGWATAYLPEGGGQAELSYSTVWWRHTAQLVQVAAAALIGAVWLRRRLSSADRGGGS